MIDAFEVHGLRRGFENAVTVALCLFAISSTVIASSASTRAQSINYNASKSNTGNIAVPAPTPCADGGRKTATGACPPGGGATSPTTGNASTYPSLDAHSHEPAQAADPNTGMVTGRRQH
jgi:hypothetical protein